MKKILCRNCGQEWIHLIRHPYFQKPLYYCPEENEIWFSRENLLMPKQTFGITFSRIDSFFKLCGIEDDPWAFEDLGEYDDSEAQG